MAIYFAPMEGLTDSVYRKLHHRYFPGIDRYYTPFLSPTASRKTTAKDNREIPPADSLACPTVPQILTKSSEDFLFMAGRCAELGYERVDLNLGCPSGTVTAKGKGSGMLGDPDALDAFLYEIFSRCPTEISIKTRTGFHDPESFPLILEIFNRYPLAELTVHPRIRDDFYKGSLRMDCFRLAEDVSKAPLCYNGNLCSRSQIDAFSQSHPRVQAVMVGRGLIGNPAMCCPQCAGPRILEEFCDALLEQYSQVFGSTRNAMFRLKENWRYLIRLFDGGERLFKELRKTTDPARYRQLTHEIFRTVPMRRELDPDW